MTTQNLLQYCESVVNEMNEIIYGGVVQLLSNEHREQNSEQYKSSSSQKLVIDGIKSFIFENSTPEFIKLFDSDAGGLKMCPKLFKDGDLIFRCVQCSLDPTCVMCEDCFINSKHINHPYKMARCTMEGGCCDCGDDEAWTSEAACSIHYSSETQKILSSEFESRITIIFLYLIDYLMKIAMSPIHWKASSYLESTSVEEEPSRHRFCVIVMNDEAHSYQDVNSNFTVSLSVSFTTSHKYAKQIDKHGFTCVFSDLEISNCRKVKETLDKFIYEPPKFPIKTMIVPAELMYHMYLSVEIMFFINDFVCKKAELCDVLSHVIFDRTPLFEQYVYDENQLWKDYRLGMIYKVIGSVLYSSLGRINLTEAFLNNFENLYLNYVNSDHSKSFHIINLTVQFITCPSLMIHLIEHHLLFRLISAFSGEIKKMGIENQTSLTDKLTGNPSATAKLSRILFVHEAITECLYNKLDPATLSSAFKSGVFDGACRFIKFCVSTNEIEPIKKNTLNKDSDKPYIDVIDFVLQIHHIMLDLAKWVVLYKDISNNIISYLWDIFSEEFSHKFDIENNTPNEITQAVLTYNNIHTGSFSIFNFPIRFFVDIFMELCSNQTLEESLWNRISTNNQLILCIGLPAIISLSFFINYQINPWRRNCDNLVHVVMCYHSWPFSHYLFEQDFNMIQILICHIDPEIFIRFFALNVYPQQRTGTDLTIPFSDLASLPTFSKELVYGQMLRFIYAALTERHFIGEVPDSQYTYLKREIMHKLLPISLSRKDLLKKMARYREAFNTDDKDIFVVFDQILAEVADSKKTFNNNHEYALKTEYLGEINRFYYHYPSYRVSQLYQFFKDMYRKTPCVFQPLNLPNLKPHFRGINDFILSEPFKNFLLHIINYIWINSNHDFDQSDILELVLLCMSLIITTLTDPINASQNKPKLEALILPQSIFEGKTIMEFLIKIKSNTSESTLLAIVDYLLIQLDFKQPIFNQSKSTQKEEKRLAAILKQSILKQLNEKSERFLANINDPDVRFYQETIQQEEAVNNFSDDVLNNTDKTFYCTICQYSSDQLHEGELDIFSFPSQYLYFAHLKWTKRLSRLLPGFNSLPINEQSDYSGECTISLEDIYSNNQHVPRLNLTGCCHFTHFNCVQSHQNYFTIFSADRMWKGAVNCYYCTSNGNIFLPYMPRFSYSNSIPADLTVFTSMGKDSMIFGHGLPRALDKSYQSSDFESRLLSSDQVDPVDEQLSSQINSAKFYRPMLSCVNLNLPRNQNELFDSIIAITHDCLASTITHLEIVNRNHASSTSLFHSDVTENTSFKVCAQLARFCYFTSGIAPTFHDSPTKSIDVKLLIGSYSRSSVKLFKILSILTNSKINSDDFLFVRNTKPLTLFISTLIGLSCIKRLNIPNFINYSFSIESTVFKFVFLILTLNIFTTFDLENFTNYGHEEDASNDEIQNLFNLYVKLCSESSNLKLEIQKSLYYTWLYGVLPFCRQASMLFYQLFDFKPHPSLTLIRSLSPSLLIKQLFNYLRIPADFGTLFYTKEIEMIKNYATKAALFNLEVKCDIKPYCINYFEEKICLTDLPETFLQLIVEMRKLLCPQCKVSCKSAFKCLICGQFIIKNYACSCHSRKSTEDIFNDHLCQCDISQGLFLRLKRPLIYYSTLNRYKMLNYPIYEDFNGEPSLSMATSFRLSNESYQRLAYYYQRDLISSLRTFHPGSLIF